MSKILRDNNQEGSKTAVLDLSNEDFETDQRSCLLEKCRSNRLNEVSVKVSFQLDVDSFQIPFEAELDDEYRIIEGSTTGSDIDIIRGFDLMGTLLPNLKSFEQVEALCVGFGPGCPYPTYDFPVAAYGVLFKSSNSLQRVRLADITAKSGTEQEIDFAMKELSKSTQLKSFTFKDHALFKVIRWVPVENHDGYVRKEADPTIDPCWVSNALTDALCKVKSLEQITICCNQFRPIPAALKKLFRVGSGQKNNCNHLVSLSIDIGEIKDAPLQTAIKGRHTNISKLHLLNPKPDLDVQGLSEAILRNNTITDLALIPSEHNDEPDSAFPRLPLQSTVQLLKLLAGGTTQTQLRALWLTMNCNGSDFSAASEIKEAVQNLTSLKKLRLDLFRPSLHGFRDQLVDGVSSILSGLGENEDNGLKDFTMELPSPLRYYPDEVVSQIREKWNETLEEALKSTNKSLETFRILHQELWNSTTVSFWLLLNKIGRKQLMHNLNDSQKWIETLVDQKDDCRVTFFLMQTNPGAFLPSLLGTSSSKNNLELVTQPPLKKQKKSD